MRRVLLAVVAELVELKAFLQFLLVLARVVIHTLAHGTFEVDEVVLGHKVIGFGSSLSKSSADVNGAGGGIRTHDLCFTKALLYP